MVAKNEKISLRNKYKRRVEWLRLSISNYEYIAEQRLQNGGKIHDRDDIQKVLAKLKELKALLPKKPSDKTLKLRVWNNLTEFFNMEYVEPPPEIFED